MERPAIVTASLYVAVFLVPGFFLYRIASPETFAVIDDYHHGVVYGSALRIALGDNPADLRINFGLISTLSAAFLVKIFAIETFGGWIRFTQFFQTFFLSCAVVSTFALERNLRLVLLVVFVTALYASTWNFLIPTPNNTGFRFLSFALLPLVLAILKRYGAFSGALIAGLASAAFVLWNAETGLACSAALFFYIFIRGIANRQNLSGRLYAIGIAAITAVLLFVCTNIGFLGKSANASLALAHLVGHAASGYNGHLFDRYAILAAGLALYASSLMIYCCLRARDATADKDLIARAALATASIVWFGYYAHNAFSFVLSVNLFLLLLTLGPLVQASRAGWLFAILFGITCNFFLLRPTGFTLKSPNFEGLVLPTEAVAYLQERNDQIKKIQTRDMFYFVSAPFITALMTKKTNDWPAFDWFAETWTKEEFEILIRNLNNRNPSLILVESDNSPLLDAPRREFLHRVRDALVINYRLTNTKNGLEFWSHK